MAVTPPTRTAGSLGTTKSNNTPVTNEPQQLSAPQYNVCADKLIEVIDLANLNEAAIAGAGGGIANYGTWAYDASSTSSAGIAAGDMRFSNADPTAAGIMYLHKTNLQGFDMSDVIAEIRSWRLSFISADGSELLKVFVSNIFDTGTHFTIQITQQVGSTSLTDNFAFTLSTIAPEPFEIAQGGTYALGNWFWTGSTTFADPGSGNINMNTSSPTSATALYVSVNNASNAIDFIEPFADLQVGDFIILRENDDGYAVRYVVTATPINNTTWFNIPVVSQSAAGGIGSSATMRMVIIKSTAAAVTAGSSRNHLLTETFGGNALVLWQGDFTNVDATGNHTMGVGAGTPNYTHSYVPNSGAGYGTSTNGNWYTNTTGTAHRRGGGEAVSAYALVRNSALNTNNTPYFFFSGVLGAGGVINYAMGLAGNRLFYQDSLSGAIQPAIGVDFLHDEWTHVGFTRSAADDVNIYANGRLVAGPVAVTPPVATGDLAILAAGVAANGYMQFSNVGTLKILDVELTAAQMLQEANRVLGR